ncbi:MAG: hypothetical protein EHM55_19770 [Acidobacteria bacterium]|nr:MAG: hypothetical protein EHM55_19770 [Acidobacteriota bacterium]
MTRKVLVLAVLPLLSWAPGARAQGGPNVIAFSSPMNIEFMSGPVALDGEPVAGAPYSAEAVTDVIQTLGDGNRIVRQNKAQVARDGQGRTRREQGFAMFGPLVNGPGADRPRHVQISDPTTGTMVMLDLQNRIAHKVPAPHVMLRNKMANAVGWTAAAGVRVEKSEMAVPPPPPPPPPPGAGASVIYQSTTAIAATGYAGQNVPEPVVEQLGTTFMEGVAVEGTRTTVTIPAGQIGNEQPISIVSERWMSPDLKVLVMSKQSDPRFGETTYRLTNLTLTEPSPQLFEIPSDFQVVEPPTGNREMIIERKVVK